MFKRDSWTANRLAPWCINLSISMAYMRNLLAILVSVFGVLLILPLLILAVPFWLIASLTEFLTYLIQRKHTPWNALMQFEPTIGWKSEPNLNAYYMALGDDVCHIITDSEGWVGKSSISESDIVVFGDSFAFGYGVNISDSYLSLNPNLRIKAVASPGYDMVQELLLMQQVSSQLRGKLVVWFICLENDLYDNLRPTSDFYHYRKPFVRRFNGSSEWEIVTHHVTQPKWASPSHTSGYAKMFARLFSTGPLSSHVYSAANFLLKEGHNACAKAGAELVVLTIPNKLQLSEAGAERILSELPNKKGFDLDYPDRQFAEMCQKLAVPFLPAKKHLNLHDYKECDWHWTKKGHKRISQLLREFYGDFRAGSLQLAPRHRHDRTRSLVLPRSQ